MFLLPFLLLENHVMGSICVFCSHMFWQILCYCFCVHVFSTDVDGSVFTCIVSYFSANIVFKDFSMLLYDLLLLTAAIRSNGSGFFTPKRWDCLLVPQSENSVLCPYLIQGRSEQFHKVCLKAVAWGRRPFYKCTALNPVLIINRIQTCSLIRHHIISQAPAMCKVPGSKDFGNKVWWTKGLGKWDCFGSHRE